MKKIYFQLKAVLALFAVASIAQNANSQCAIGGLGTDYCVNDGAVTMVGTPAGGTFSGNGVTGDIFDPAAAGAGLHTVTYDYNVGGARYYIKSNIGNPWGNTTNDDAMNLAFGAGNWTLEAFETVNVGTVFSAATAFIFMDGSDSQASELTSFLMMNQAAIETWVSNGGTLLLNSAPNEGGNINFGFGGSTLVYAGGSGNVVVQDLLHPAFVGPNVPTTANMTGSNYSHANITGTGFTNLLVDSFDPNNVALCEKPWGSGIVMMGGMTTSNFHSPLLEAQNWRANLLVYLDSQAAGAGSCSASIDVTVHELPSIDAAVASDEMFGNDGSVNITVSGGMPAYTFDWDNDGTGDFDDAEDLTGVVAGTYTVVVMDQSGCSAAQSVVVGTQVGVDELSDVELSISPNPATELVTILLVGAFDFELTDLNGAVIMSGKGQNQKEVNVSELANGTYLMTVEMNDKAKTVRFVKQ